MTLVVDCSVALKWVLLEDGREAALGLIGQPLIAPDFLKIECANVLAMKVRRGLISDHQARLSLRDIEDVSGVSFRPAAAYVPQAQDLALELQQTVYDCLYLALALEENAEVVTADLRFASPVMAHAKYRSHLRLL